jgi:hypothetical protein
MKKLQSLAPSTVKDEFNAVKEEQVAEERGQKRHKPDNAELQPAASLVKADPDAVKAEASPAECDEQQAHIAIALDPDPVAAALPHAAPATAPVAPAVASAPAAAHKAAAHKAAASKPKAKGRGKGNKKKPTKRQIELTHPPPAEPEPIAQYPADFSDDYKGRFVRLRFNCGGKPVWNPGRIGDRVHKPNLGEHVYWV